jgi:antitoxin (DNA-binding transcriptional repressor) of toxin-antitoxin stability system
MTVISIEQFREHLDRYLAETEGDVILTRDGKPCFLLRALRDTDGSDTGEHEDSPEFWQMIHQRRQEKAIPWEEAKTQLDLE